MLQPEQRDAGAGQGHGGSERAVGGAGAAVRSSRAVCSTAPPPLAHHRWAAARRGRRTRRSLHQERWREGEAGSGVSKGERAQEQPPIGQEEQEGEARAHRWRAGPAPWRCSSCSRPSPSPRSPGPRGRGEGQEGEAQEAGRTAAVGGEPAVLAAVRGGLRQACAGVHPSITASPTSSPGQTSSRTRPGTRCRCPRPGLHAGCGEEEGDAERERQRGLTAAAGSTPAQEAALKAAAPDRPMWLEPRGEAPALGMVP